jgi:hypothetical protein
LAFADRDEIEDDNKLEGVGGQEYALEENEKT